LRILIADDHEVVRRGVRSILESRADWEICGEAANGQEAIDKTRQLNPDLIVLDITMPVLNGLDAARSIRKSSPNTVILILSMHVSKELIQEAQRIGAKGFVVKGEAGDNLVKAVDAVTQFKTFFPTEVPVDNF
jgi:DNA-binding NarL/FixJ family response regulator